MSEPRDPDIERIISRRRFIQQAAVGTTVVAMGGLWVIVDAGDAAAETRPDGRPRVPPGQRVIQSLKPMGGQPGSPSRKRFRLKVHGEVKHPFELDFDELRKQKVVKQKADVHCVTAWSALGIEWEGVRIKDLAEKAGVKKSAHYAIIEAAHGYTANVPIAEALKPNAMVTWEMNGKRLRRAHGAPVRALIPDLYFWKSSKWLTGIKFVKRDEPGYWEQRGYHNHGDPWREQRHG